MIKLNITDESRITVNLFTKNSSFKDIDLNETKLQKNLTYTVMESVVKHMVEWGSGSRGLLDTASCLDAMGLLIEAKEFLIASWKVYDQSNLRNNQVKKMKSDWLLGATDHHNDQLNNKKTEKEQINAEYKIQYLSIDKEMYNEKNQEIYKYNNENNLAKNNIDRADIVAYLEALDQKTNIHTNNNILQGVSYNSQEKNNVLNSKNSVDYRIFQSPIKKNKNITINEKDYVDDELAMDIPAFVVSGNKINANKATEKSLFSSPLPKKNSKNFENFDKKLLSYSKTPLRSPRSIYPFVKSQMDCKTPTKKSQKSVKLT
ncbi:hypothetical protein BB561_003904 [Smittium simulii]|uniref:Uncharacterized protein n=1 Tax=Smittium simulii TaxID=133385 RepID=A0A2T9YJ27_9FUNG|nr:hypothetical protein BB561_003904 [Smittium simulii]